MCTVFADYSATRRNFYEKNEKQYKCEISVDIRGFRFLAFGTPYMRAQEKEKEYFCPYTNRGTSNENAGVRSELSAPPPVVDKLSVRIGLGNGLDMSLAALNRVLRQVEANEEARLSCVPSADSVSIGKLLEAIPDTEFCDSSSHFVLPFMARKRAEK